MVCHHRAQHEGKSKPAAEPARKRSVATVSEEAEATASKKPKGEENGVGKDGGKEPAAQADTTETGAVQQVDVREALAKILKGLGSAKKFGKAVDVLLKLMERELPAGRGETPGLFVGTITEFLKDEANVDRLAEEEAGGRLYAGFEKDAAWFSDWDQVVIGTLHLLAPVRATLASDDSFTFRKACKAIRVGGRPDQESERARSG